MRTIAKFQFGAFAVVLVPFSVFAGHMFSYCALLVISVGSYAYTQGQTMIPVNIDKPSILQVQIGWVLVVLFYLGIMWALWSEVRESEHKRATK